MSEKLRLTPMAKERFADFAESLSVGYAKDQADAGIWAREEALFKARMTTMELLPDGVRTKNHFLWEVMQGEECIGTLWVFQEEKTYFIYDILIFEAFQNKGLGSALLDLLEEQARERGITEISLHAFAHNKRAVHVYKKMGFEIVDITMRKYI
ncbi:GNAT family N-acetyltransferase [Listeria rocourtiae]|uniref:GNAT family N-acetyltransferase n=1 Tax=Listeria rocourtiae TaxID=647910 RepID=UPI003D2F8232